MNRFLGIFSVALALALSFSACSNDDNTIAVLDNTVWVYNNGGVTINLNFTGNNSYTLGNAVWVSGSSAAAAAIATSSASSAAAAAAGGGGGGGGGAAAASSSSGSSAAAAAGGGGGGGGGGAAAAASSSSSSGSYLVNGSSIILVVNGHQYVGQYKGNTIVFVITYDDGTTTTYVFTKQ
ncbi:MAG: hypothetical protein LBR50_03270 [Tannerella sp.]|jgi:hypothetical protein|nr:hypothetical protein [Tannerella sp.]